ncbi:MAG: hypothetical protein NTU66_06000 [Elusimicrobia bacterium]|nr:hypothetical protein [Elusimicrobiota bacterium]
MNNWNEGTIETSSIPGESVTDNSGETVTNNADAIVDQSELYGFERKTDNGTDYYLALRDFGGHYASEGRYVSKVVDLLAKVRARISISFNYEGESCAYAIYITMSDNMTTWSESVPFSSGEYECRCFKIIFVLANMDTNNSGKLIYLQSRSTVRLFEQRGNDVNVNQSLVIAFDRPFYAKVNIQVIAQGLKYARVVSKSLTSFTVEVRNDSSGTLTSGTVDWVAKGY